MSVLYLVVPLAVAIVLVALFAFAWATRQGQFDDLDTPAMRMLNDDTPMRHESASGSRADGESRLDRGPAPKVDRAGRD